MVAQPIIDWRSITNETIDLFFSFGRDDDFLNQTIQGSNQQRWVDNKNLEKNTFKQMLLAMIEKADEAEQDEIEDGAEQDEMVDGGSRSKNLTNAFNSVGRKNSKKKKITVNKKYIKRNKTKKKNKRRNKTKRKNKRRNKKFTKRKNKKNKKFTKNKIIKKIKNLQKEEIKL